MTGNHCFRILCLLLMTSIVGAQSPPLSQAVLSTTNPKLGETWNVSIQAGINTDSWLLLSSLNNGPTVTLAGLPTFLSADWQILDARNTGGSIQHPFSIQVPPISTAHGVELVAQAILHRPATGELGVTNPALIKLRQPLANGGKYVLLVRQVSGNAAVPFSATQADALALSLMARGHDVTIVDDEIPAETQGYDVILDCRFDLPPSPLEADRVKNFLATSGGVFFLSGPWAQSTGGQLRLGWLDGFVNQDLGIPTVFLSGLGFSNGSQSELVDPFAPADFLTVPNRVSILPYDVEREGGHFGPVGFHRTGKPMITGSFGSSTYVYGMMWEASHITTFPSNGRVAILLNGAADSLGSSPTGNPHAEDVFENIVHWLDS